MKKNFHHHLTSPAVAVSLLLFLAFSVRLYRLNGWDKVTPMDRYFHVAMIARADFFETEPLVPQWRKEIARIQKQREWNFEPRVIESLTSLAYQALGAEHLWIPRFLSAPFWVLGGFFIYLISSRMSSQEAGLFSTAFYLFLPYSLCASRNVQPDPLMIFITCMSLHTLFSYFENPSFPKIFAAAISSALASLVKPVCVFPILGSFLSMALHKRKDNRVSASSITFIMLTSILPAAAFYGYKIRFGSFIPSTGNYFLLLQSFVWSRWLTQIRLVIGYPFFLAALVGLLITPAGLPKALLRGLWIGYFLFGLAFNYKIATHSYYQLLFIPIVSLSIAPVALYFLNMFHKLRWPVFTLIPGAALAGFVFFSIFQARSLFVSPKYIEGRIQTYKEIGERVAHSTKTMFLGEWYGKPLEYYGEISTLFWPRAGDLRAAKLLNHKWKFLSAEARFRKLRSQNGAEYFIVTDFNTFHEQSDLEKLLTRNFPILAQTDHYLIFDIRRPSVSSSPEHT